MGVAVIILMVIAILLLREAGVLLILLYVAYIVVRRISKGRWLKQSSPKTKASKLIIPVLKHVDVNGLSIIDNARLEVMGVDGDLPYAIIRYGFFNVVGIGVLMLQLPKDRVDCIETLINDMLRMNIRGQIIISTGLEGDELRIFNIIKSSRDTLPCGLLKRKTIDEMVSEVAVGVRITSSYSSGFKILKASEIPILLKEVFT